MPGYPGPRCSMSAFLKIFFMLYCFVFLRLGNWTWGFGGLSFGPGIFWVLLELLGIVFGTDFCPHSIIPVFWTAEYPRSDATIPSARSRNTGLNSDDLAARDLLQECACVSHSGVAFSI